VINTPAGPITQGAKVPITWSTKGPTTQPGTLTAIERTTQNTSLISENVDINTGQFDWVVDVNPGTYNLAMNDGSGNKFSGAFDVIAPKSPAPKAPPKTPAKGPVKEPKLLRRALPSTSPQPSQSANSASTKSTYDLLLGLMTVAVIMVHSA